MNLNGKVTNPGELRTKVTLQRRTVTTLAGGFQKPAREDIATVWAKWENVHGSEAWQAANLHASQAATVTIRYRADVDTTCYVMLGSQVYEIVSMDDVRNRHEYIELKVRRVVEG